MTRDGRYRLPTVLVLWCSGALVLPSAFPAWAAEVENRMVAIVNDEAMTQLDLEAALFDQVGTELADQPQDERLQAALQQLIEERLILQAARQAKVTLDEQIVEQRLAQARRRFESDAAFDAALLSEGLTRAMLRKRYRDQLMMQQAIDREVRAKLVVTPSEVARYFHEHPEEMQSAPRVHARHLLVRMTAERSAAEALAEAFALRRKIDDGTPFAEVARASSEGPEAAHGGDLGWIEPGHLRPELDEVLFRMEPGIVSDPIRSSVGYHLVVVEEREAVRAWAFEEVQMSVREKLLRQKFERKLGEWLAELRAKAYIVIKLPSAHAASSL